MEEKKEEEKKIEIQCKAEDLITNKRCIKLTINILCEDHTDFMEIDWNTQKEKIEI